MKLWALDTDFRAGSAILHDSNGNPVPLAAEARRTSVEVLIFEQHDGPDGSLAKSLARQTSR